MALAATQGLNEKVEAGSQEIESGIQNLKSEWTRQLEQKDAEIAELKEQNAAVLLRLDALEQRLK